MTDIDRGLQNDEYRRLWSALPIPVVLSLHVVCRASTLRTQGNVTQHSMVKMFKELSLLTDVLTGYISADTGDDLMARIAKRLLQYYLQRVHQDFDRLLMGHVVVVGKIKKE